MKLLGVTLNEHLKFNSHLDERDRIMNSFESELN